ncbi:EAL domain-containing protein [Acidaminobacter sp. JC074]|uniref:EAL domain-containing protein n=1 Tax=Acidaminobacter sp. JC074 TaxID=2530199 RepID=UPI001F0D388C|nr:EAL domain-containing protein [Acidaminobacter sp. JC074]MCH4888428.1 EAL domain-containing protein [Acidaminobacter sp. JC074]
MKRSLNSITIKLIVLVLIAIMIMSFPLYLITSKSLFNDSEVRINELNSNKVSQMKDILEKEMILIESVVNSYGVQIELYYDEKRENKSIFEDRIIKLFTNYLESSDAPSYSIYAFFKPSSEDDILDIWLTYQEDTIMRHEQIPYRRYIEKDNMSFFYDVENSNLGYWIPPYRNRYDEYITSYVRPLIYEDQFIGIIGMYLDMNKVRQLMSPLNYDDTAYYWCFNDEQEIIYHPLKAEGDPANLDYDHNEPPSYVDSFVDNKSYRHYISNSHNDWTYVYSVENESILKDVRTNINRIFITYFLFIVFFSGLVIAIVNRYVLKINEVSHALKKAQLGNYAETIKVTTNDEVGILSQLTNDVLDKVANRVIKLEHVAYYNTHTGLANLEKLKYDLKLYGNREMALYLLDLDNFRVINDILGKRKSDAFIKEISNKLREAEDHNLFVYHTSGDEFAFLEFDPKLDEISTHAEYIINLFNQIAYSSKYHINISSSIGISKYPDDVGMSIGLIECAQIALETAKKEGRNNYKMFSRFIPRSEYEHSGIYDDLRKSIFNDEFILHYQNIYNKEKVCVAKEALVRWNHPDEGLLMPADFISHIEMSGLDTEFGQNILKRICHDYKTMKSVQNAPKKISMNLSHRQLLNPLFISNTLAIIRNEQLTPDFLTIEVTEDILKYDIETSKKKLEALKVLGITVELDDFGRGDASLNTLSNLPINKVKIDCYLITQLISNKDIQNLVNGLIQLCHQMDYIVVAECVENEATYNLLVNMGCDQFQGFYFDKPKAIEERSMNP